MIEMVKSDDPLFHTLHRAWSACAGLPQYDKNAWKTVEREVIAVDARTSPDRTFVILLAIEALLTQQGGEYDPT